jgi:hypothetical protein
MAMILLAFGLVRSSQAADPINPPAFSCQGKDPPTCVVFVAVGSDTIPVVYDSSWQWVNDALTFIKGQKITQSPPNPIIPGKLGIKDLHTLVISVKDDVTGSGHMITYWTFVDTATLCANEWGIKDLAPAANVQCPGN